MWAKCLVFVEAIMLSDGRKRALLEGSRKVVKDGHVMEKYAHKSAVMKCCVMWSRGLTQAESTQRVARGLAQGIKMLNLDFRESAAL